MPSMENATAPTPYIPTFWGKAVKRQLVAQFGLSNSAPTPKEEKKHGVAGALFKTRRVLFIDDDTGKPVAYWTPRMPHAQRKYRKLSSRDPRAESKASKAYQLQLQSHQLEMATPRIG